ncbi:MAG: antibiotic biosynthesis monooxygenase [Rhodospirillaceae bacterium]|nr:antibiotic biosynthesis monooxygenase [Rhodospirillaceae bacterium]
MFVAMNRFRIARGREADFERIWAERDTYLDGVPGFMEFRLLRGPEADDHTLYASHSIWTDRGAFEAWTRSEAFRKAHAGAGERRDLYLGHPEFEGFETVLDR